MCLEFCFLLQTTPQALLRSVAGLGVDADEWRLRSVAVPGPSAPRIWAFCGELHALAYRAGTQRVTRAAF